MMYLSFVGEEGFRGGCFIEGAVDIATAVKLAHATGINPGGEVVGVEVPTDLTSEQQQLIEKYKNNLLDEDTLRNIFEGVSIKELEEEKRLSK